MKWPKCVLGHRNELFRVDLAVYEARYFYRCRKCGEHYPPQVSSKDAMPAIVQHERRRRHVSPNLLYRMV